MPAKIWDTSTNAFKDAETPQIHNGNSFGDAEGKIWNETAQAWEDAWSSWNGELYDQGNEFTAITGGWLIGGDINNWEKQANSFYTQYSSIADGSFIRISNNIDVTEYTKLCASVNVIRTDSNRGCTFVGYRDYWSGASIANKGYDTKGVQTTELNISSITGNVSIGFWNWSYGSMYVYKVWLE